MIRDTVILGKLFAMSIMKSIISCLISWWALLILEGDLGDAWASLSPAFEFCHDLVNGI